MLWFKKKQTPEEAAAAWLEANTELQRRYAINVGREFERLLPKINPQAEPVRRMEDLRDSIAIAALNGILCANYDPHGGEESAASDDKSCAENAYAIADAMMVARNGKRSDR